MILDIQTISNGIVLRGTSMAFTTTYLPTSTIQHNSYQLCVEVNEQLIIFDCRDTTINGAFQPDAIAFKNTLGL